MRSVLGLVTGVVAGSVLLVGLRGVLAGPVFERENHRGHRLPTAGGLVVALATLAVVAAAELTGVEVTSSGHAVLLAAVGFALLGFVDDVAGGGADGRGFRGHLRALAHGRLTTGGLKLLGGGALAVAVCAVAGNAVAGSDGRRLIVDAALVALAANLGNLFDRAPGRVGKLSALALVVLLAVTALDEDLAVVAVVVGAGLALLPADLGERLMLGDTGANTLGGALGLGVVLTTPFEARVVVLVAVVALNASSEVVSFSRVIDAVAPLRLLDRLGRR